MTSTRVVLVRHGQSESAVLGIVGGRRGCTGLSDLGVAQVEALGRRVAATGELAGTTVLLSSALARARHTAGLLAPALGGLDVVVDPDLGELDPGEGDGLTWAEWQRRYGGFDLAAEPLRPLSPGGESWADFERRAGRALARSVTDHAGGTVVACCHGGIIGQALVLGPGATAGARVGTVPNASLNEWEVQTAPGSPPSWRLVRYGDDAHLDGAGRPRPVAWRP